MNYVYALVVLFWLFCFGVGLLGVSFDRALAAVAAGVLALAVAWLLAPDVRCSHDHPMKHD